jgi:hypothetical protein
VTQERRDKIVADHPLLFSYPIGTSFDCGDGWLDLIEDLANKLEPLIKKFISENPDHSADAFPCASQVKEKYGTLRFYMLTETDEICKLIHEAEDKSAKICENCGKEGQLRGGHWYHTLCDGCWEKRNNR